MSYIIYAPSKDAISLLAKPEALVVSEIWRRLPPCDFTETRARNRKKALVVEQPGIYIWVPPTTVEVLEGHPLLSAIGTRFAGKLHFFMVEAIPKGMSREDFITRAQTFNEQQLRRAKKAS